MKEPALPDRSADASVAEAKKVVQASEECPDLRSLPKAIRHILVVDLCKTMLLVQMRIVEVRSVEFQDMAAMLRANSVLHLRWRGPRSIARDIRPDVVTLRERDTSSATK
jgi:hypothetical protein